MNKFHGFLVAHPLSFNLCHFTYVPRAHVLCEGGKRHWGWFLAVWIWASSLLLWASVYPIYQVGIRIWSTDIILSDQHMKTCRFKNFHVHGAFCLWHVRLQQPRQRLLRDPCRHSPRFQSKVSLGNEETFSLLEVACTRMSQVICVGRRVFI